MTDKKLNKTKTDRIPVSIGEVYVAEISWFNEERGHIASKRIGHYYYQSGRASSALSKFRKFENLHPSSGVFSEPVVFVGKDVYSFANENPEEGIDIVEPSDLENRLKENVALKINEGKIVVIYVSPLRVQGKPYVKRTLNKSFFI